MQRPDEYDEPTCGPGPFSMANADTVTDQLMAAGFEDISLRRCDLPIKGGNTSNEALEIVMSIGPGRRDPAPARRPRGAPTCRRSTPRCARRSRSSSATTARSGAWPRPGSSPPRRRRAPDARTSSSSAEGRVAYERRGEGPPLVLLHGAMADNRDWRLQLDGARRRLHGGGLGCAGLRRLLRPARRLRAGGLRGLPGGVHPARSASTRLHVMGLSFGSVPRARAVPQPSAAACAASSCSRATPGGRARWAARRPRRGAASRWRDLPPRGGGRVRRTLFDPIPARGDGPSTAELMADFRPAGIRAMANALADADLREVLPDRLPVLLSWRADQRSPSGPPRTFTRHPGLEARRGTWRGPRGNLEAPERVNDEVRSFLRA